MLFSLSVNGNNREVKCYLESDNWIVQNLNNALETWNSKLSEIWQLLTQSPETFKGGDIWSVMLTIHDALKGIGYGLLVLFFAISVVKTCSSYLDVKKPEHVKAGSGLIRCSGNLVPFENTFPRNTKLYQLMTTKPGESLKAV